MRNYAYYNGSRGPIEEMMIPVNDRSTYFGDGVYDAALVLNRRIFALKEHMDRFYRSCSMLKIDFALPRCELESLLYEAVGSLDEPDQFLYWQSSRGTAPRKHAFAGSGTNLLITAEPKAFCTLRRKYKLITVEDTRFFHCNIKTLNLIPNVMASQQAAEAGCDEVVFHRGDMVTECAHSNLSILKDGVLKTAPTNELILPGITRSQLVSVCHEAGVPVDETAFTLSELMDADEVIVTSTTIHFVPVSEIDGAAVGGKAGELLKKLQMVYLKRIADQTGFDTSIAF